jgi:hypothetical protein
VLSCEFLKGGIRKMNLIPQIDKHFLKIFPSRKRDDGLKALLQKV